MKYKHMPFPWVAKSKIKARDYCDYSFWDLLGNELVGSFQSVVGRKLPTVNYRQPTI